MDLTQFNFNWIIAIVIILALAGLLTWAWWPRSGKKAQQTSAPPTTTDKKS
jgi:predicted negative regulator of RcsB-dependent stress response